MDCRRREHSSAAFEPRPRCENETPNAAVFRAGVAVPDPFEVWGRRTASNRSAVGASANSETSSPSKLSDHEVTAKKAGSREALVDSSSGGVADEQRTGRGEAVRLGDERSACQESVSAIGKPAAGDHVLRRTLRAFDAGGLGARAEDGMPVPAQFVREPAKRGPFFFFGARTTTEVGADRPQVRAATSASPGDGVKAPSAATPGIAGAAWSSGTPGLARDATRRRAHALRTNDDNLARASGLRC